MLNVISYVTTDNINHSEKKITKRKIISVHGIPFYQSSGENSTFPGTWFPFLGIEIEEQKFYAKGALIKPQQPIFENPIAQLLSSHFPNNGYNNQARLHQRFGSISGLLISAWLGGGLWDKANGQSLYIELQKSFQVFFDISPSPHFGKIEAEYTADQISEINAWLCKQAKVSQVANLFQKMNNTFIDLIELQLSIDPNIDIYLRHFQSSYNLNRNFPAAILASLELFAALNPEHIDLIKSLMKTLSSRPIGQIMSCFSKKNIPLSLKNLIQIAHLIEQSIFKAQPEVISGAQNKIAESGHNPRVIFEQIGDLENLSLSSNYSEGYTKDIKFKLKKTITMLYERVALMILDARDYDDLKETLNLAFCVDKSSSAEQLVSRKEIKSQIKYLKARHFFKSFYYMSMDGQYDYVQGFNLPSLKSESLKLILNALEKHILNKALESYEIEKHRLMKNNIDVCELFDCLEQWSKGESWSIYRNTTLMKSLYKRLDEDKEGLFALQKISHVKDPVPIIFARDLFMRQYVVKINNPKDYCKQLAIKGVSP